MRQESEMHVKFWLIMGIILILSGCSTQKNAQNVVNGAESSENAENTAAIVGAPTIGDPQNDELPVKIEI